ncbi:MAG: transketolase [Azospirillaceae bacterium]|nr:transketolase [Azospirillaceae bacterium]
MTQPFPFAVVPPQTFAAVPSSQRAQMLALQSREMRKTILQTIAHAGLGHIGGDLSVIDILATLFFAVLRVDPDHPQAPDRDRFILSKGHCAVSLYTVLARAGFIPGAWLADFAKPMSPLSGHPNRNKVPGVESCTGPLGHGLPVGVGCAIAARMSGASWRTFVVLGDGELQEGSNWEAAMAAGHRHLSNLVAVIDRNRLQMGARTEDTNGLEPLADKWRAFGWAVMEVDGHDHEALYQAFTAAPDGKPRCVIANTVKGKGVSFMEDRAEWHHKVPNAGQLEQAIVELSK